MSEMEMFIGRFEEAEDQTIFPEDTDDFYEFEEKHNCHYVSVNGKIFKLWAITEVDAYGFQTIIPQQDGPLLICYWYNGGAGLHEVAEQAIEDAIKNNLEFESSDELQQQSDSNQEPERVPVQENTSPWRDTRNPWQGT